VSAPVRGRPAAFAAVGALAAGVHLCAAWLLVEGAALPPAAANVGAFLCAFPVSYLGHRRHTFGAIGAAGAGNASLPKWLQVSVGAFGLNQALYVAALRCFPHVWYLLLLAFVTATVAAGSYCLGRIWAFRP